MKKVILSLAGLLAATAFAPEASAIPAFARQVGMACKACHFQHFPLLNQFGRAFKASGFTMMGAQGRVEDEQSHTHLSIPDRLNISALATAGYNDMSNNVAPAQNGSWMTPNGGGELSLFFGGRVSENIGFLSELAFPDNGPASSAAKLPLLWDVGGARIGLVAMSNNAPAWSFELLNTGAVSTHRLMGNVGGANTVSVGTGNHINATSAAQYLGTKAAGHGVSFVATGDMGFVNIGKYNLTGSALGNATVAGTPGAAGATAASPSNTMSTTYARAAYIFNVGGWDSAIGIQSFSGSQGAAVAPAVAPPDTKATIIDGQMQGEMGGMPVGLYASYGTAPTSANGNIYNPSAAILGAADKKSFNIVGELGVIPHKATVQLAFRSGRNGTGTINAAAGGGDTDNAVMLAGTYELAQNAELSLTYTSNSGNAYNAGVGANPVTGVVGKTQTTLLLEALF